MTDEKTTAADKASRGEAAAGRSNAAADETPPGRKEGEANMAAKTESPADSTAELNEQIKALREDVSRITETLKAMGMDQMENVQESIRGAVNQAGETVRHTASEARHRGEEAASEMEAAIHRNPFTALLIALGLGFIVGTLSRR